MKTLFIPAKYRKKLSREFMKKVLKRLDCERIGLFTTVQFLEQLKELKSFLESNRKKVFVGKTGQVLGCDVSSPLQVQDRIDAFLYLGSGIFHQLNLAVQTDKKIIQANPFTEQISELSREQINRFKKAKEISLKKAVSGKTFGILVCTKSGQHMPELAEKTKKFLENRKKKVYMFLFETLNPDEVYNFPQIDVWINTACVRIGIDDVQNYPKPIVNAEEFLKYWGNHSN